MTVNARGIVKATLIGLALFGVGLWALWQFTGFRRLSPAMGIAQSVRVRADIAGLRTMLMVYQKENGAYPSTEQGLAALVAKPAGSPVAAHWTQRIDGRPTDPWGTDYIYRCPGKLSTRDYDLFSAGPDRRADTADDDWGQ